MRCRASEADAFLALARRRRDGEPVAYLTGIREFWGLPLAVSPAVLIPRPETETLVEIALARLPAERDARVLDLGTGLRRDRAGDRARAPARAGPRDRHVGGGAGRRPRQRAAARARATSSSSQSDWYASVPAPWHGAPFDLIVSNPPYVAAGDPHLAEGDLRFEPASALTPGGDGLDALRRIVAGARARLVAGGTLVVEHGYDQADAVRALFLAAGFVDIVAGARSRGHSARRGRDERPAPDACYAGMATPSFSAHGCSAGMIVGYSATPFACCSR